VRSYDIKRCEEVATMETLARAEGVDYLFTLGDTREVDIEETDLLFVDTDHTYAQVKAELERHAHKVRRYLIFHDTVTYKEIVPAIEETLVDWYTLEDIRTQHGLLILEKRG